MFETGVLVLGGGMGGMVAAARAAQLGARVTVVEKGPQLGGSAVLSGGYLWTAQSYELLREYNPLGDPGLGRVLTDDFAAATEWARGTGAWFSDPMQGNLGYGHGTRFDVYDFVARCAAIVESAGGSIVLSCRLRELIAGEDGVTGALVTDRDGETEIRAGAVVLATGGWQGNPLLREKYLGPNAGALRLRANPHSTGDALEAALAIGAGTTERMDPFYGHLVAHPIEHFVPGDYLRLSQIWCYYGVLLDMTGRRFTDESIGYHTCAQDLLGRPGARGLLVADEELRRQYIAPPLNTGLEAIDRLAEARDEGAHVVSAPTIEELAASAAGWGYDEAHVVSTLHDYNGAMCDGAEPPDGVARKRYRISLTTGPFHAMEVTPAITFSHGGLRADEHARVLSADGRAIPGLYAVGSDAAGAFCRGYAGGLANAAVFGLRAAADAVRSRGLAPAAESKADPYPEDQAS